MALNLGQAIENVGTALGLPEWQLSERVAGGKTALTNVTPQSQQVLGVYNPWGSSNPMPQSSYSYQTNASPVYKNTGGVSGSSGPIPATTVPGSGGTQMDTGDGGFGEYFKQLDAQIEGLGGQRASQEQIAQNTYNQGLNTLNSQLTTGKAELEANQQKTLRDLAQNMRQSWQQGNAMLGTRGASDSSAANQYAYALTKFGNQQRGDVQAQYQGQLFKLQNLYDTESKNLELQKNTQLQQIAQWFAEAQNQLRGVVGQAKLQQGQQAYNNALQMMQQAQQEAASRRAALDQWALNRATSYGEAAKAMGVAGSTQAATPTFNNLFGNVQNTANRGVSAGYNYTDEQKRQLGLI